MKVLLVKMSALGDIVHTFPVVSYLHSIGASVDWVVDSRCETIPTAHPLVSRVISVDTKKFWKGCWRRDSWRALSKQLKGERYDLVIDLQGNIKSGLITALSSAREKIGFGWSAVSEWPNLLATNYRYVPEPGGSITDDYLSMVKQHLQREGQVLPVALRVEEANQLTVDQLCAGLHSPVVVCPGSRWTNKKLPLPVLQQFLLKLEGELQRDLLVIWGSDEERREAEWLCERLERAQVVPRLPIPALQYLMSLSSLVVSMDSLPLHLASAAGVPTFSIFGASSAEKYAPVGEEHASIQGRCPYGKTFVKRCPKLRTCSTGACIKDLTADMLWDRFSARSGKISCG